MPKTVKAKWGYEPEYFMAHLHVLHPDYRKYSDEFLKAMGEKYDFDPFATEPARLVDQVKAICVHYFCPCGNKVFHEFIFIIILCINFSIRT